MRKSIYAIMALTLAVASCDEFEPVYTLDYDTPTTYDPVNMDDQVNTTIAELKALYTTHGVPVRIEDDIIIKGEVTSSDEEGNIYREIYIQDETGAIDIKIGRSSSYDDYKVGQTLYVKCKGLALGEYGYKSGNFGGDGQLQLGMYGDVQPNPLTGEEELVEYETSYIELQTLLDQHIFKGKINDKRIQPLELTPENLNDDENVGKLVTLKGLTYGNSVGGKEVFVLFYPDPNLNHTKYEPWNRVFLSAPNNPVPGVYYTFGILTWALTKPSFLSLVTAGAWDNVEIGDGSGTISTAYTSEENFGYVRLYKDVIIDHPSAQSVSHYFMFGDKSVQIRTSGYARFADVEIPIEVRNCERSIDVTGILSRYQGSAQFLLLNLPE